VPAQTKVGGRVDDRFLEYKIENDPEEVEQKLKEL